MSDHNVPDATDKAYLQAEAMLDDDDAARAARRARVLGAVAAQAEDAPVAEAKPRSGWGRSGWLMAACVAGIGAVLAVQLSPTGSLPPAPSPTPPAAEAPSAAHDAASAQAEPPSPAVGPAPAPVVSPPAPAPTSPPPVSQAARGAEGRLQNEAPVAALESAPAPPLAPRSAMAPQAAPPSAFPASQEFSESVANRRVAPSSAGAPARSVIATESDAPPSAASLGARLRAAAASGRIEELRVLLADGAPIDAADTRGETALMKAVQANHPAAAALLRREGASLTLRNRAGLSAREMATAVDDAELTRALGTAR